MPRGRRKKAAAEVEILPPDENSQPLQQVREIKHTAQWIEQRPIEDAPEEEGEELDDDSAEDRPRRKIKNAREELRKKLRAQGISPGTNLRLYIEKYLHSDSNTSGSYAETEFCTKYETTEDHILNKDYIDVARRWGAGKYRITIRMQNKIADAFDERISATPQTPIIQTINPNDPNSPQVIVGSDGQQAYQPMSMKDIMKSQKEAFKEQLEMAKLMREAYGIVLEQPAQPVVTDPKIAALQLIAENPDVMEKIGSGIAKTILGSHAGDGGDAWAEVAKEAIKSGQAAEILAALVREIMTPFRNIWGNQNNGQAQMNTSQEQPYQGQIDQNAGEQNGSELSLTQANEPAAMQDGTPQHAPPEEQALAIVINNCARKVPPSITADQVLKYADLLNDQAPQYSIDGYLEMFSKMTSDQALEFVKTQPNGEAVTNLEHAKSWCEELQKLIQENFGGEE